MKKYIVLFFIILIALIYNVTDQIYDHEKQIRAYFKANPTESYYYNNSE